MEKEHNTTTTVAMFDDAMYILMHRSLYNSTHLLFSSKTNNTIYSSTFSHKKQGKKQNEYGNNSRSLSSFHRRFFERRTTRVGTNGPSSSGYNDG